MRAQRQLTDELKAHLTKEVRATVQNSIAPRIELACRDMFSQIHESFKGGVERLSADLSRSAANDDATAALVAQLDQVRLTRQSRDGAICSRSHYHADHRHCSRRDRAAQRCRFRRAAHRARLIACNTGAVDCVRVCGSKRLRSTHTGLARTRVGAPSRRRQHQDRDLPVRRRFRALCVESMCMR